MAPDAGSPSEENSPLGLGQLFEDDHFEVTVEEINTRVHSSLGGGDPVWDEFTGQLIEASPVFMAGEILRGPSEPPYRGRFLVGPHHEEWDELVIQHERLCILAPRDHGKCMVPSALICTADGRRVRHDQWEGGVLLAYDPKTHQLVPAYAPPSRPNGVKSTLRIRLRSGRVEEVTHNHPLRKLSSWCRADELRVGERIAVPYRLRTKASHVVEDAWLVGLLVGDGGLIGSNVVLSTGDQEVLRHASAQAEVVSSGRTEYRLKGMQPRMRELGLMGKSSHEKRVPDEVLTSTDVSIAEFVSGYLDADAHVNFHGGGSVEFYSVSEDLSRDVQHLLTRLGVLSVLSPKKGQYRGEDHWSWRLTVRGKDILALARWVNPRGSRGQQLRVLASLQEERGKCSGNALDRFPLEVWDLVQHSEDWFRQRGLPRPNRAYEPTREKLSAIAKAEGNTELLALTQADILWDEIVEIEDAGEQETWSLHVPGYANYVSNDIVNHNTYFWDFAVPIWKVLTQPGGIGFIFSASTDQAIRILGDIRDEVESNPRLQHLIPAHKERWSSTHLRFSNGHQIYARGFGTKVRGAHPTWIVVDDGLNDETAYSEQVRRKQIDYFYTAITNMIVPGGQVIVVGTPFHEQDLYSDLKRNSEYKFAKYQALNGPDELPLWPHRYTRERLLKRREEIGPIRFTREFQCEPVADDMSLFPSRLFKGDPVEQMSVVLNAPKKFWDELGVTAYMGVDFAMSASVKADWTVVWIMGVDKYGNRWVMDVQREKGMGFQDQLSLINRVGKKYQPALILVEANQMQRIFGDELARLTDLPVKKFVTTAQAKNALDKGVPSLRILLENKKFRIPKGDANSVELMELWQREMASFTWQDGKLMGVGMHDDTVMACWIADQAIRMGGFDFTFGDESDMDVDYDDVIRELTGQQDEEPSASGNLMDDSIAEGMPLPGLFQGAF